MMLLSAIIGVVLGSFGNVLIDRLPRGEALAGRSKCEQCKRILSVRDLVPIVSWVLLRGKCRTCNTSIPWRLPAVEATSLVLGILAAWRMNGDPFASILLLVGLWLLFIIAVIDLRTQTIPDALTASLLATGVVFQLATTVRIGLVAALLGALFFGAQWMVSRGRWVGTGDILLAAAIGFLVGTIHAMVWVLLLAYIIGAVVALLLIATKRVKEGALISFGPFLALAAGIVLLLGEQLPLLPF